MMIRREVDQMESLRGTLRKKGVVEAEEQGRLPGRGPRLRQQL